MQRFVILALTASLALIGCGPKKAAEGGSALTKLEITDLKVGNGKTVQPGDSVYVHYKGWLDDKDHTVFDENGADKDPYNFVVGAHKVIAGWDQGIIGMKAGGKRHLHIPAAQAYGDHGQGKTIPANADLNFDIELVRVSSPQDRATISIRILKPGHGPACKVGQKVSIQYKLTTDAGADMLHGQNDKVTFTLGKGQMISDALDDTIEGMKVGEVREVQIPPGAGVPLQSPTQGPQVIVYTFTLLAIDSK